MDAKTKVDKLCHQIQSQLSSLVGATVALFGLPCHGNIGDTYIALGELSFLKSVGAKIIYKKMLIDSTPLPKLPVDCIILLQGGGDFGDVWRGIQECRLAVLEKYKYHKIVIFPQSVFYADELLLKKDAAVLNECRDLTICARDQYSFGVLKKYFSNNILLVPDMAFFMPRSFLLKACRPVTHERLFLKRIDKEASSNQDCLYKSQIDSDKDNWTISDWPTIRNDILCLRWNLRMVGWTDALLLRKLYKVASILRWLTIAHMLYIVYPIVAKAGIHFLSSYKELYLTRLHSAILAVLLGRKCVILDNSYHKNRNFFETWLYDLDSACFQDQ